MQRMQKWRGYFRPQFEDLIAFRLGPIVLSSSRHGRRSPLFFELSRCSRHSRNEEKRNSQSESSAGARSCRILLLFCFEPRRCLDDVPVRASLSSTSRFVSSRLYRPLVRDQNWSESPRYLRPTVSFRGVQFPDKNELYTSPCTISTKLVIAMNWKTNENARNCVFYALTFNFRTRSINLSLSLFVVTHRSKLQICLPRNCEYLYVEIMYNCKMFQRSKYRNGEKFLVKVKNNPVNTLKKEFGNKNQT